MGLSERSLAITPSTIRSHCKAPFRGGGAYAATSFFSEEASWASRTMEPISSKVGQQGSLRTPSFAMKRNGYPRTAARVATVTPLIECTVRRTYVSVTSAVTTFPRASSKARDTRDCNSTTVVVFSMTKGNAWAVPKDRYQKSRMKPGVMRTGTYSILDLPTSGSGGKKIHWGRWPGGRCLRRHEPAGSDPWGFMPAGIVPGAAAPNKVLGMIISERGSDTNHANRLRRSNPPRL